AFQTVMAKETDAGKRGQYADELLPELGRSGQGAEAYALAPNRQSAFRVLAAELQKSYRQDELRRLVIAHGDKHPSDPVLPLYWAEVYTFEGKYRLADKAFAAALAAT